MAGTNIKRNLPNDEYNAAVNANSPSAANPFATIADASSIYTADGTIATTRVATIQNGLTWSGSTETRITNTRTIKEVISAADIGTTLAANTTYVIIGKVTLTQTIQVVNVGSEVVGLNRDVDEIDWRGGGNLFDIRDQNFHISNLKISSSAPGNNIIKGTNVGAGYNFARNKVLTLLNCQFRGTYDVMDIDGFDLVDINNCLFFYIKATNWGLRFRDTSKIEITSCELIRWFDETTIPTPSGYATVAMIELQANLLASFGAININGCIIHPQQNQTGIDISTASTTGFGTISSNAFINVGLTPVTGNIFLPINVQNLPDYSVAATECYDIFANQGLLNSTSGTVTTVTGNTTDTAGGAAKIVAIGGGLAIQQAGVRFVVDANTGRNTYTASKQVYVSIHCSFSFLKQGKGTDDYTFYIAKNGATLPGSELAIPDLDDLTGAGSLVYGALMEQNDYIELWVSSVDGDGMRVLDYTMLIRE